MKSIIFLYLFCISIFAGPNDAGGGGGVGFVQLNSVEFDTSDNFTKIKFSKIDEQIILKDAVDIRLLDDRVIDIDSLVDMYQGDVVKSGDFLKVMRKIPIADYQNMAGEIISIQ